MKELGVKWSQQCQSLQSLMPDRVAVVMRPAAVMGVGMQLAGLGEGKSNGAVGMLGTSETKSNEAVGMLDMVEAVADETVSCDQPDLKAEVAGVVVHVVANGNLTLAVKSCAVAVVVIVLAVKYTDLDGQGPEDCCLCLCEIRVGRVGYYTDCMLAWGDFREAAYEIHCLEDNCFQLLNKLVQLVSQPILVCSCFETCQQCHPLKAEHPRQDLSRYNCITEDV